MLAKALLLLLRVVLQLNHFVDLLTDLAIRILQLIRLVCQFVDIVEEGVVLLLGFDEAGHNLIDSSDTCCLLDLLEGILDDLYISQVLVHEPLLLAISGHDLGETQLEDSKRILELPVLCLFLGWGGRLIIVDLALFLFLVEFLLVALDFCLEMILVFFMLGA